MDGQAQHSSAQTVKPASIRRRLVIWMLLLVLTPLAITAVFNFLQLRNSLVQETEDVLLDDLNSSRASIEGWFNNRIQDLSLLSLDSDFPATLTSLSEHFDKSTLSLKQYTQTDEWSRLSSPLNGELSLLKKHYDYIYDISLIDIQGNILFTLANESDLGTNLNYGPYAQTRFAEAFRSSLNQKDVEFSDFERYAPSENMLCGFFVAPLLAESGQVTGVLAVQVRINRLLQILSHRDPKVPYQYLVGSDGLLRTPLRSENKNTVLVDRIDTEMVNSWRSSLVLPSLGMNLELTKQTVEEYVGPQNKPVFGISQTIDVYNTRWLLVTEIESRIAMNDIYILSKLSIFIFVLCVTVVVVFVYSITHKLMRPLEDLAEAAEQAAEGMLDNEVEVSPGNNDEIGRLARAFNRMLKMRRSYETDLLKATDEAKAANKAKSDFLACMSHEIRTPMNGVLGMLGLMKTSPLPPEQERKLTVAHNSAQSLLSLINDILDFSKVEAGKLELEYLDFLLSEQLVEVVQSFSLRAEEKNIELILDATGIDQVVVNGDPSRLRQILINLVGNAIKFTHEGEVVVKARIEQQGNRKLKLLCAVKDTGIGIPKKNQNLLFDSFTQVDVSTTRKFGGTGLGLAICKNLCELMHGSISLSSEENVGSEFAFSIELGVSEHQLPVEVPKVSYSALTILVVDDNLTNRLIFREQLEQWGITVEDAEGGEQALKILSGHETDYFDVILLDYHMPEMDGVKLGAEIRRRYKDVPMMLLSSVGHADKINNLEGLGFTACLIKPVVPSELFDAIAVSINAVEENSHPHMLTSAALMGFAHHTDTAEPVWSTSSRILIVEDNSINQEVVVTMLGDLGLYCDVAENGVQALNCLVTAAQSRPYHLVFMDCQMPEMDGYEATRRIRKGEAGESYKDVVIIAMTANAMQGDKEQCLAAGMNDYLSKPIDNENVSKKLTEWLPKASELVSSDAPSPKATTIRDGDLNLPLSLYTIDFSLKRPDIARKASSYLRLLGLYIKQNSGFTDKVRELYSNGEIQTLRENVHAIKGASGNLGMMPLYELAGEQEAVLRGGELINKDSFFKLTTLVQHSLSDAQSIIDANTKDIEQASARDYSEVRMEVVQKLEQSEMIDQTLLNDFKQSAQKALGKSVVDELMGHLESFDYDEALAVLKQA